MATGDLLLEETADETVDSASLRRLHQNLLRDGHHTESRKEELVAILGGMDKVLQFHIDQGQLSTDQMEQIHTVLTSVDSQPPSLSAAPTASTVTFNEKNTFLLHLLDAHRADLLLQILYHRVTTLCAFVLMTVHAICVALQYIGNAEQSFGTSWYTPMALTANCLLVLYFPLILLSVNRRAMKLSMKTFEFWFKFVYALRLLVSNTIYIAHDGLHDTGVGFAGTFSRFVLIVLVTVLYSSMDGLHVSSRIKTALGVAFVSYISVFAFYYTTDADPYLMRVVGFEVDLVDLIASSNRVLSLFILKQALLYSWKADQATVISTQVNIQWIDTEKYQEIIEL